MRFHFSLAFCFLFAFTVLANRHRDLRRSSGFLSRRDSTTDPNWSGAAWDSFDGTFTSVAGTFSVPVPTGNSGSSASVWIGIDGRTCNRGLFQTGVDISVLDTGFSYRAWTEWVSDFESFYFSDFTISAHDQIRINVTALSTTSGITTVENLSNGQHVTKEVNSTQALCGQSAEWVVEDYVDFKYNTLPLANFGTVFFTDAKATGPSGTFTPNGATLIVLEQNHTGILTSVSVDGNDLLVTYVGP